MSKKNGISMNLPSVDDIFTTQEERDDSERELVKDIPIAEISDFPNHPFKVKMDENMTEMIDSIRKRGVLLPAVVREKPGGGYEMVSGHRRKFASEMAERTEMPCIIRDMTDDEAILVMVDSNLQREKILPSEKAFAYKMKLEAMKRQGRRMDLTSTPVVSKLRTNEIVGEETGELDKMLTKIADFYDTEVDTAVKGLTSVIEPLVIVVLGIVIGGIVMAVFMPMLKLVNVN